MSLSGSQAIEYGLKPIEAVFPEGQEIIFVG
jgi:hypothetical protein